MEFKSLEPSQFTGNQIILKYEQNINIATEDTLNRYNMQRCNLADFLYPYFCVQARQTTAYYSS